MPVHGLTLGVLTLLAGCLVSAHPAPGPPPPIKQTVGSWTAKGCYRDFGSRPLTFRFDVPEGNTAERCTALCKSKGYGIAGMEYGTECWCDNYMPYGPLMPASDCSFPCPGDSSESCGAGNRMVVYTDSEGTPPSPSTCITWRDCFSWGNGVLDAVPKSNTGGAKTRLYSVRTDPLEDPTFYTIISTCPAGCPYTDYYNFGLVDGILTSYNNKPIAPAVGESQSFIFTWPQTVQGYNGYCAKPNPYSPDGPYIGHPLLSVNGQTDQWALCPNTTANGRLDIVYSPVANHAHYIKSECTDVWIELGPYSE